MITDGKIVNPEYRHRRYVERYVYEALPGGGGGDARFTDVYSSDRHCSSVHNYKTVFIYLFVFFFISSENAVINVREFLFKSFRIFSYKKKSRRISRKKKKEHF